MFVVPTATDAGRYRAELGRGVRRGRARSRTCGSLSQSVRCSSTTATTTGPWSTWPAGWSTWHARAPWWCPTSSGPSCSHEDGRRVRHPAVAGAHLEGHRRGCSCGSSSGSVPNRAPIAGGPCAGSGSARCCASSTSSPSVRTRRAEATEGSGGCGPPDGFSRRAWRWRSPRGEARRTPRRGSAHVRGGRPATRSGRRSRRSSAMPSG